MPLAWTQPCVSSLSAPHAHSSVALIRLFGMSTANQRFPLRAALSDENLFTKVASREDVAALTEWFGQPDLKGAPLLPTLPTLCVHPQRWLRRRCFCPATVLAVVCLDFEAACARRRFFEQRKRTIRGTLRRTPSRVFSPARLPRWKTL